MKNIFIIVAVVVIGAGLGFFLLNNDKGVVSNDPNFQRIMASGELVVGVDFSYGVMEFYDENNNPVGIDIDIINEIAKRTGLKTRIESYEWEEIFEAVKAKEIDVAISSITITPERGEEMLFSAPYFNGGQTILVRKDNSTISSSNDLQNKRVGAQTDTTSHEEALKMTSADLVVEYASWEEPNSPGEIIDSLINRKIDAVIVDNVQAVDSIKQNSNLRIAGEPFTQEFYGIATSLDNLDLVAAVNTALRDMKRDGTLDSIVSKWTNY